MTAVRTKPTRSGKGLMAYVTLEDLSGSMELTLFPLPLKNMGQSWP